MLYSSSGQTYYIHALPCKTSRAKTSRRASSSLDSSKVTLPNTIYTQHGQCIPMPEYSKYFRSILMAKPVDLAIEVNGNYVLVRLDETTDAQIEA